MISDWFLAGLDDNLYLSANEPFPVLMMIFHEVSQTSFSRNNFRIKLAFITSVSDKT